MVIATIGLWYWMLGSVSVQTVASPKVEVFYWTTIMFSQTLGTALGDWMADTGLGYNDSALVILLVLGVIAVLYYFTGVSRTLLFWAAFILTRPLGATIANSFDKPIGQGGLAVSRSEGLGGSCCADRHFDFSHSPARWAACRRYGISVSRTISLNHRIL